MTTPDLARLTPEEAISLKRCETHKAMADKAAGLFSKEDRESKREWERLNDAMGLLEYLAATTDLPAAVETISALRAEIARLRERLGQAAYFTVGESGTSGEDIIWHSIDGWHVILNACNQDGEQETEIGVYSDADSAFAALERWKGEGE